MNFPNSFQLCDEVDRIHTSSVNFCRRMREGFTSIVPKVVELVKGKTQLAKMYSEARAEMLAEDQPGITVFGMGVANTGNQKHDYS